MLNFFRRPLWHYFVGGIFLCLVAAILSPVLKSTLDENRRSSCLNNLQHVALAMSQYAQDYDERLPRISIEGKNTFGWADALQPYTKKTQVLQCLSQGDSRNADNPRARGYTDYWMNANLSGISTRTISDEGGGANTILAGEGADSEHNTNARYNIKALPEQWVSDQRSPLYRHLATANYLFVDGHVHRYQPHDVHRKLKSGNFYFTTK